MTFPTNSTAWNHTTSCKFQRNLPVVYLSIVVVIFILIVILSIIGNFLLFQVTHRNHLLSSKSMTALFLNLALSHLITTLCKTIPDAITTCFAAWWSTRSVCQFVNYISYASPLVSALTVAAISYDRFIMMTNPFTKYCLTSDNNIQYVLIGIWLISYILPVHYAYTFKTKWVEIFADTKPCYICYETTNYYYYIGFIITFFYLIPLFLMFYCGIRIAINIVQNKFSSKSTSTNTTTTTTKSATINIQLNFREKNLLKIFASIIIVFALSQLPQHLVKIFIMKNGNKSIKPLFVVIAKIVSNFPQFFDPWIYSIYSKKEFKSELKNVLTTMREKPSAVVNRQYDARRSVQAYKLHFKVEGSQVIVHKSMRHESMASHYSKVHQLAGAPSATRNTIKQLHDPQDQSKSDSSKKIYATTSSEIERHSRKK